MALRLVMQTGVLLIALCAVCGIVAISDLFKEIALEAIPSTAEWELLMITSYISCFLVIERTS
jgi:hypothetical protein